MHILYFADTRFPIERANGLQTMATCHALAARGHQVTLVVRPDTAIPSRDPFLFYGLEPTPNLTIRTIAGSRNAALRRARFLIAAAARACLSPADVVYTRDLGVASFLLQSPAARARVVYESHGIADVVAAELPRLLGGAMPPPSRAKIERLARKEAHVWRRSAAYVTITNALASDLAARFGKRERVFVVPDGAGAPRIDRQDVDLPTTPPNNTVVVGYAGHLYPWKGVDVLVEALRYAPMVSAIIVGGHPAEADRARVEQLARTLGVDARIAFAGPVLPSEVASRLAAADVLVLPNTASSISERYTSPLKLFEYLALGRAIVASDLPSVREILSDGQNAVLVPAGDAAALGLALVTLSRDQEERRRLGSAAAALAPNYTWTRRAERLEPALEAARV